jgi:hypothetical protein
MVWSGSGNCFACGRWAAPTKVRVETKTVEVVKEVEKSKTDEQKHEKVVKHEIDKPDGTKDITTTTTENDEDKTQTDTSTSQQKETDASKEIDRSTSKVTVAAIGAVNLGSLTSSPISYGLSISKPVLGPFTLQAFGLSNATVGMGIGLTF